MESLFWGVFDQGLVQTVSVENFLLCLGTALLLGVFMALCCWIGKEHTASFLITVGLLPAVVCVVIMMVNGNVGAGVAVAGAFSLVRFRSAPGSAKEIVVIFLAMGVGLMAGMGYLGFAVLFALLMGGIVCLIQLCSKGFRKSALLRKTVRITLPEDLDYTEIFEDVFSEYAKEGEQVKVKTVHMGSMFQITYHLTLKEAKGEKAMIDRLRERNGNLEIIVSKQESDMAQL